MATHGPRFSLSIEDLALNLLLERETSPRARLIIDHLTQLFAASACVLYLLKDDEPQQWYAIASGGELSGVDALIAVGAGTLGRLAASGVPAIYSGSELQREDYAHLTVRRTVRSLATVPILSSGAVIGAIEVVTFDQSLDQDSLAVIKQVAEYAAPALTSAAQNDQQTNAHLSSITRLTTLYDLERVFHSTLQMDDLFPIVTSKIRELVEVQAVNLWMVDGDKLILMSSDGIDPSVRPGDIIPAAPGTIPGSVSDTGEGICIEDANDERLRGRNAAAEGSRIFSLMAAPVLQQGALVGVLEAINRDDGVPFDEDDLFLLSTISESAAGALYNASLLEAERKVEILQTLVSVSQEITSTLSMDRVLTAIVNGPSTVIPYERASIALEQHGRLRLQAMSGVTELKPGNPEAARLNELLQWVAPLHEELRVSQTGDEVDNPREETRAKFKQYFAETGMRGFYSLSLTDDQGRVGVLAFESSNPDFLSTAHLEMIKILASQATVAVRNAQMYTEVPFIGVLEPILQKKKKFMAMEKRRRTTMMVLAAVAVGFLVMFPLPMRVDGSASVEPVHSAMVQPEVEGVVKAVNVREGDHVQKGTVLATLQDWDYRSSLAAAEAKYGMAQAAMNRALAVNDSTEAGVQRQQADYWRAEVDRARERLAMTQLRSPIEGYVATPQIENLVGRHLSPGDTFAEIVDTSHTTVDVAVEEKDVALLRQGDKTVVKLDGYPARTFKGRVVVVSPKSEPQLDERFYYARVDVPNSDGAIRSGMQGQAKVSVGWHPAGYVIFRRTGMWAWSKIWGWWG